VNKNEIEKELAEDGARDLLANASLLRLAYNGHDGSPRAIPIGFFWDGTAVEIVDCVPAEYLAGSRKTLPPDQVAVFERSGS
jgi:hypothetical protein